MGNDADRPWGVFARRPAPLADVIQFDRERMRGDRARADGDRDGLDEVDADARVAAARPAPPD